MLDRLARFSNVTWLCQTMTSTRSQVAQRKSAVKFRTSSAFGNAAFGELFTEKQSGSRRKHAACGARGEFLRVACETLADGDEIEVVVRSGAGEASERARFVATLFHPRVFDPANAFVLLPDTSVTALP